MKQSSQLFHDSIDNTANQRVTAQTPLDIMEEYNGCSVPQYTAYPMLPRLSKGGRMKLFGTTVVRMVHSSALTVSERGTDICGRTCILTFSINGPSGTQTTGPTVLTLN